MRRNQKRILEAVRKGSCERVSSENFITVYTLSLLDPAVLQARFNARHNEVTHILAILPKVEKRATGNVTATGPDTALKVKER